MVIKFLRHAGLEVLKREMPDLLLSDIMPSRKDGYDVMKEIKEYGGVIKNMPAIILSNLSSREDFFEAKRFGAADYLVKSKSTPADVLNKINTFFATGDGGWEISRSTGD